MQIKDLNNGKLITLSKPLGTRAKKLNLFYFLVFIIAATAFLRLLLFEANNTGGYIISSLAVIAFYIGAYRFANKAVQSEKIFIGKAELQLIKTGLFNTTNRIFKTRNISNFRFLPKEELTRHPLAGDRFDYLGFQTEQKVISDMHGEKRIAFDYSGREITFGDTLYSWEFDELEILLYDITGNDLRYDDEFEKAFEKDEKLDEGTEPFQ